MSDDVEYGTRGTLGLLVPQANTTAEPEVQALMGPDLLLLTGRLTSPHPGLQERMVDYLEHIEDFIGTFANAPLAALGFLITGATYHFNPQEEDAFFAGLSAKYGYPIISAGQSIRRAFAALGAQRIALVSPYPDWLTERSAAYWKRAGVEIAAIETPVKVGGFHNIYTIRNPAVLAAARRLAPLKTDLVLLAGAGMPTLGPIMALADEGMQPISSNLCMAWALMQAVAPAEGGAEALRRMLRSDAAWRGVFSARFPGAVCAS